MPIKEFELDGKKASFNIIREYKTFNIDEQREIAHGYSVSGIILKTAPNSNVINEVYKNNVIIKGVWYPWVSYTLDFKEPIDYYELIRCGSLKNKKQVYNHIWRGQPMPFGLKDKELPYRDIPKIPEIFYEQKVDFNTIFCWSKKPSGLVIEYTFKG